MPNKVQNSSASALTQYTRTINRTKELLGDFLVSNITPTQRSALLKHFRKETRDYDKYMRERRKLWFALINSQSTSEE